MKKTLITVMAAMVLAFPAFSQKKDKKSKEGKPVKEVIQLKNKLDTISYILGSDIGKNIKASNIEINNDVFIKGLQHGQGGIDTLFTKTQIDTIMMHFQEEMVAKQQAEGSMTSGDNKAAGAAFLAQNKTRKEVKTTPSGLQYEVLVEGTGGSPTASDEVTVYYSGKLLDGKVFDETKPGSPISFGLSGVIPGWTEGLQLMKEGGKNTFYIPSELAYGDRPIGPIPAGSTLIFDVELVSIKKK